MCCSLREFTNVPAEYIFVYKKTEKLGLLIVGTCTKDAAELRYKITKLKKENGQIMTKEGDVLVPYTIIEAKDLSRYVDFQTQEQITCPKGIGKESCCYNFLDPDRWEDRYNVR